MGSLPPLLQFAIQYGFIPAIVLYGMKKDPRIGWTDVLAPWPTLVQPGM